MDELDWFRGMFSAFPVAGTSTELSRFRLELPIVSFDEFLATPPPGVFSAAPGVRRNFRRVLWSVLIARRRKAAIILKINEVTSLQRYPYPQA